MSTLFNMGRVSEEGVDDRPAVGSVVGLAQRPEEKRIRPLRDLPVAMKRAVYKAMAGVMTPKQVATVRVRGPSH